MAHGVLAMNDPITPEHAREFDRLTRRYSWDLDAEEARQWPRRLLRRVMDMGTWDDILSMEQAFGHDLLVKTLVTTAIGGLRPKSWTFWHYRLGIVPPGADCPPLPTARMP